MNTDAKPMFLVNGVSPLPFSSGWTEEISRKTDIQGMVKTQRHEIHSVLINISSCLWLSGDRKMWHVIIVLRSNPVILYIISSGTLKFVNVHECDQFVLKLHKGNPVKQIRQNTCSFIKTLRT